MRIVFVGANDIAVMTAKLLLARGHEVVLIESNRVRIEELYDELDCSFLHGDGSRPMILKEADPRRTDVLFCLTSSDRTSIVASLVGRSLGFRRIVTSIDDPELEGICVELGLDPVIVLPRTMSRHLVDLAEAEEIAELSTALRGEARFFVFHVGDREAGQTIAELGLPERANAVCVYREGEDDDFEIPDRRTRVFEGDEVVVLTHSSHLPELQERWRPSTVNHD